MTKIKTSIQPWLSVSNSAKAAAFYIEAFGATESYRLETPDGGLVVRISVEGAEFWVSGGSTDTPPEVLNGKTNEVFKMVLTVQDPDALFKRALEAGGKEVFPVGEDYGWRLGRFTDPFGFDWEIGKPLPASDIN